MDYNTENDTDKTRLIRRKKTEQGPGALDPIRLADPEATRILDDQPSAVPSDDPDKTIFLEKIGDSRPPQGSGGGEDTIHLEKIGGGSSQNINVPLSGGSGDKTQLVRRASKKRGTTNQPVNIVGSAPAENLLNEASDPVAGWLVVVDGPGKGMFVAVGEQDNRIGRGGGAGNPPRACLNFGDASISRTNAFVVRYDPKKRRFKILPGEGTNIVYLNDEDLDAPSPLKAGDKIEVGDTKLQFVPFCGADFDWSETDSSDAS